MKRIHKYSLVIAVVCIALLASQVATTTEPATVTLIETKITAHEDAPIIIGNHSLEYIVIQGDMVYGVPVNE